MRNALILTVFVCLGWGGEVLLGCRGVATDHGDVPEVYKLNVGKRVCEVTRGNESVTTVCGGGNGEIVRVDLNGHPILFTWKSKFGSMINQFLVAKPLQNKLLVVRPGKFKGIAEVAVGLLHETPVAHLDFSDAATRSLLFYSEKGSYVSFETIDASTTEKESLVRSSLTQIIRELYERIKSQDGEGAASILYRDGYCVWSVEGYGASEEQSFEYPNNMKKWIEHHGRYCLEPDWNSLNFVIGDKSVYVYAKWRTNADEQVLTPYLFEFVAPSTDSAESNVTRLWPLRFVRTDGVWRIWDCAP